MVGSLETENKHLLKDIEMYKRKIDALEDLSRDNERLKYDHMIVSKKHSEIENTLKDHITHRNRLTEELDDHKQQIKGHLEKIKGHEETHKILHGHKVSSEQALQYERERASAAEEKIAELQEVINELKDEIVSHQDTIGSHTTKLNDHTARATDLTNALSSMFNSIKDWEAVITIVLEGVDSEGNHNRSSPIHHDDDVDDPATSIAFLSMTSFDLVRKVSTRTERMDGKIARLVKLRKTLDSQMGRLLSTYTEKLGHTNDKCALLEYKAADLERKLDEARNRIETHHGHLSTHTRHFEEFRERITNDHAARVKELAANHSALQHIHELEKQKCFTASEELEKSRKEIVELKELVEKYVVQEEKMEEVSETNRLLTFEVEDRGEKLKTIYEEHEELIKEFQSLQQKEMEESRVLVKQSQQIQSLEEEVRFLSSRQMDPTLQQTIMQTQGMLQCHIDSKSANNMNTVDNNNRNPNWQNMYVQDKSNTLGDMIDYRDDPSMPLSTASLVTSSSSKYRFNPSPPNLKTNFNAPKDDSSSNEINGFNGMEPAMAMSYSRGSFNPSPPNLRSHAAGFAETADRDVSTSMVSAGMMNSPAPTFRGGNNVSIDINNDRQVPSTYRNGQYDVNSDVRRPGADFSNSLPASRVQVPATSYSYADRVSVQLQDPTPSRRLDIKTLGGEDQKERSVTFPYRGSNVVVSASSSSTSSSSPQGNSRLQQQYSSSSSSYTNRGTISLGVPRGYDEVNPMAFNIMGSPSTDVMSNKGAGSVATAGATPYKSSSPPSYNGVSSKRWEYSNSATPLQRQSLGRSGNAVDSLSNRLEDIEHRKSKLITKVMHH